ncbi:MAG: ABC transporter substrate-binding protein, partial [Pseudomonadota bacterium]|nr:ABC transporter substrate-binding protein [Pseudomonadota bacterium]
MGNIPITIATNDYDRTRAVKDGAVSVDGCDVTYLTMLPEEMFFRAVRYAELDVTELSLSTHMLQTQRGDAQYLGIPVFLSRVFRHSGFYIRTDRGIASGADLKRKKVGVPEYQMTAAVWQRGLLKDEFGIEPWEIAWRTGGLEETGREERTPINLPDKYDLQRIGPDQTLSGMLESGELDAVISPPMPSCLQRGAPNVARLWPEYRTAEQDYFRRTGIFPIMHILGVKKTLAEKYPWLPANLYKAYGQAKALAYKE